MVMGTGMNEIHKNQFFLHQDQFLDIPFQTLIENSSPERDSHDDSEIFSDIALNYIHQMLMDEDDKIDNFHEYSALEAAEKPFYEILAQQYPPNSNPRSHSPDSTSPHYANSSSFTGEGSSSSSNGVIESNVPHEYSESQLPFEFGSQPLFNSINSYRNTFQGSWDGLNGVPNPFLENLPAWSFNKGVEEARKFLPSDDKLVINLESNKFSVPFEPKEERKFVEVKPEKEEREFLYSSFGSRGRKNPHSDDDTSLEEGRSVKQSAVSNDDALRSDEFDEVLLCHGDTFPKAINDIREALQHVVASKSSQNGHGKGRGKKQTKKEVVDLRTLLVHCAQMVAADDQRSTNELLKQIRQHSSPTGDGSQRLAHYFANALEARLAGTGREIYNSYRVKRRTATDYLKAYQLYLAACPFKKLSHFFSNQTIMNVSEKAKSIHVVDFGISFGFQWPSLIQRLSARPNGVPKLRITGIDLPQPGFRPAERIEETGRRLADYARSFNVPFEYKPIASKWEDVRVEDLEIDKDEVLVVNCLFQFRYLADETVVVDSPRNMVLNTIRKMNPDVFIHGIVNGSYSAPFFVTRFREALYHFSALYDMLETIVPREDEQRLLIEREIFGREALNVIACEGLERMERPETYKQWQVRNLRAGFVQHHVNRDIVKKSRDKVRKYYHKDFNIDEDSRWLLQGWKGRIVYALSSWKPSHV
ncbi:uncharacterized protein A4U43_C02F1220 [Asparagus officinalis]|uniref:Uncharacterized protein n=1 Tax=Asparagus officinalis TaxID=4686 RepID=A0A5P1FEW5_ASPOF|nr:scarecrow-like protein 9 [Asparagus officinalis]ONK76916.1 uncharacterized protein A4U43_C02F1220 [Asparagus officinalis]